MKKLMTMISAAFALLATSCMEHHVTISLNKDGSGTITEETVLGAQMLAMIQQMSALGGEGAEAADPLADMVDKEKAEATAKEMGEGVTVSKVEKIDEAGRKGARTVYAFKDINAVKYGFGSGLDGMGDDMGPGGEAEEEEAEEPMKFVYKDSVLTLKNKGMDAADAADEEEGAKPEAVDPAELAQAKQMLGGMKMSIRLEFPGGIEETNATHRKDNTVTMMEMDMGALLEDPEAFAKLQQEEPESPAEMAEVLKGVKGMKVETNEELRVKLK
ncbi:hypothetical protein [Haloferula sp. A504]|uniref:hypothetical protein n=1 Tax=Haloferula sp. A504 TaxID=3373601 RepID=UPI0031BDE7B9|nr:hypothetical protein [Verrucomicrobiaceae bacterium E54]